MATRMLVAALALGACVDASAATTALVSSKECLQKKLEAFSNRCIMSVGYRGNEMQEMQASWKTFEDVRKSYIKWCLSATGREGSASHALELFACAEETVIIEKSDLDAALAAQRQQFDRALDSLCEMAKDTEACRAKVRIKP